MIKYEIVKNIGVVSTSKNEWNKELNIIAWNDNAPKFDIRDWSPDHAKMSKGITLTKEEAENIYMLLDKYFRG